MSGNWSLAGTGDEQLQVGCLLSPQQLRNWHKQRRHLNPDERLTRINCIIPKMVGKRQGPMLKSKGAEAWGLVSFLIDIFTRHGGAIVSRTENLSFKDLSGSYCAS